MLAHDPLSSLAYPMITHTPLAAGNLPIKTLVVRQQPTSTCTCTFCCMHLGFAEANQYGAGTLSKSLYYSKHHNFFYYTWIHQNTHFQHTFWVNTHTNTSTCMFVGCCCGMGVGDCRIGWSWKGGHVNNWGTSDYTSHAPQLMSCNYYVQYPTCCHCTVPHTNITITLHQHILTTVDPRLSECIGTEPCSDKWNIQICECQCTM